MKKKIVTGLVILTISLVYLGQEKEIPVTQSPTPAIRTKKISSREVTRVKSHNLSQVDASRTPAQSLSKVSAIKTLNFNKHPKTDDLKDIVRPGMDIKGGYVLAQNVFALSKDEFNSSMGEKLRENSSLVFFKADSRPTGTINVAMDPKNSKLYPVSSALKLVNVSEETRQELLSKGLDESYYHESLKIMFVQSTHDEVLKLHAELTTMKLGVELEVMKGFHRVR